jgi:hypothetical protein
VEAAIAEASALAGKSAKPLAQPLVVASLLRLAFDHGAGDPDQPAGATA